MTETIDVHKVFATHFDGVSTLAYAVSKTLADGSICLDINAYLDRMKSLAELEQEEENPFWQDEGHFESQLVESTFVGTTPDAHKPFIIHNHNAYLHRYFHYESQIIKGIERLGEKFKVITGGPGTGKTYGLGEKLVKLLIKDLNLNLAMAAPTGKAAARMNEAIISFLNTGLDETFLNFVKDCKDEAFRNYVENNKDTIANDIREKLLSLKAQTLHKLLGVRRNSVFFHHDSKNPLPFDVVVVDEASMIDGALMAKLLDAIHNDTLLFLVGDKDQLASVEAGSVFGDICRASGSELLEGKLELKDYNWRAEDTPELIKFSENIIDGKTEEVSAHKNNKEVTIDKEYSDTEFVKMASLYKEYIEEEDIGAALIALNRVRFLCVTRQHEHSVAETNARIEKLLKKTTGDAGLFAPKEGFYHNQPIIITQNDYDLDLRNGDVGLIRRDANGELQAHFDVGGAEPREIKAGYLNSYETVFAMTIHKSQGSEFENVVVILPAKRAKKLLTRELLYTGVTRARKKVLIQASEEVLRECIEGKVSRASGITERIKSL